MSDESSEHEHGLGNRLKVAALVGGVLVVLLGALAIVTQQGDEDATDTALSSTATAPSQIGPASESQDRTDPSSNRSEPSAPVVAQDPWIEAEPVQEALYDPSVWFEVLANGRNYLCTDSFLGFQKYDCQIWYGQPVIGQSVMAPDLYCSGSQSFPDCSPDWYPSDLHGYEFITFNSQTYVCEQAFSLDYDWACNRYWGGNPGMVLFGLPAVVCTGYTSPQECWNP